MESKPLLEQFGFLIAPFTPHIPDVILCRVDARTNLVSVVGGVYRHLLYVLGLNPSSTQLRSDPSQRP